MCCIFGGHNKTRESQYQMSEFALKIGMCRVLDFLCLIEFSSDLHSIFYNFDYSSFTFFVVVAMAVLKVMVFYPCKGCNNKIHITM